MSTERTTDFEDQDFAYLTQIASEVTDLVVGLKQECGDNKNAAHATFWLTYLKKYNTAATSIRGFLTEEGIGSFERHEDAIRDFLRTRVKYALDASRETGFFNSTNGEIFNENAQGINAYIQRVNMEEADEIDHLISIPGRIRFAINQVPSKA